MPESVNLLGLSLPKMRDFFEGLGEKPFRAAQLLKWIHQRGVTDFEQMTDLSKVLKARLATISHIQLPEITWQADSNDGTRKWVMKMPGGSAVETVFIPEDDRGTLCVSSQIGCALDCSFCSTGKQGFNRDLSAAEIIAQVWLAVRSFSNEQGERQRRVTNVVLMGMGEPLMNFDAVMDAVSLMLEDNAYGISKRRVTISTSGVVPEIRRLSQYTDAALALSLHAPNDALRDVLVPVNRKWPIAEVLAACNEYMSGLGDKRVLTVEYTLMSEVNDEVEHAHELALLLKNTPCKINLIPFNPFPNSGYSRPSNNRIHRFRDILQQAGYVTTVRKTRGDDIDAACGQLVGRVTDITKRSERFIKLVETGGTAASRAHIRGEQ